jgi:hypothetical protein
MGIRGEPHVAWGLAPLVSRPTWGKTGGAVGVDRKRVHTVGAVGAIASSSAVGGGKQTRERWTKRLAPYVANRHTWELVSLFSIGRITNSPS